MMHGSLMAYAVGINKKYIPAPHHRLIGERIQAAFEGRASNRLMIFAPPRHGKSELTSKIAPAYFLGRWPDKKVIAASHTQTLADGFGRQVRDILMDPLHAALFGPEAALNPKTTAAGEFTTMGKGEYFAVGVGGTPIGKGGDLVVIDDPFKSREEAESPRQREKVKDWYTSSIYSRLEGNGVVVLMHQRWHEDDLAGWLLREHADENWEVINLPALCEKPVDELGRIEGEALWPEKYDEFRLHQISRAIGPRDWLSMYQQRPRSQEGDEFKRSYLRYYERPAIEVGRGMTVYILVDAASSKKKTSDYTAMAVIGIGVDGNKYLLDGVRDRLKLSERAAKLMELHRKWNPRTVGYEQYGQMADIEHIQTVMEQENYRFVITPLGGRMRKEERIRRMLPDLESNVWWFPEEMWVKSVDGKVTDLIDTMIEEEMVPFPVGRKDDFIDCLSRIYDVEIVKPRAGSSSGAGVSKGGPRPW